MYISKRSLKVYEAPLGLNSKQQIPRIQLQDQWLKALGYHGLSEWFLVFFLGIYGILYVWMLPYKAEDEVEEENESIDIQA